jgi:hypothetical protein
MIKETGFNSFMWKMTFSSIEPVVRISIKSGIEQSRFCIVIITFNPTQAALNSSSG